jgi:hypothetical protein
MLLSTQETKSMASQLQIEANRNNAQKCTGPTSVEGKNKSSQNALKTGLDAKRDVLRTENRADFHALIAEFHERFLPATPEERSLVDALIRSEWLSRRYMAAEASVWEWDFKTAKHDSPGIAFIRQSETLARVDRRLNSAQRNFQAALKQLRQLQASREKTEHLASESEPIADQAPTEATATEPLNTKLVSFLIEPLTTPETPAPRPTASPEPDAGLPLAA